MRSCAPVRSVFTMHRMLGIEPFTLSSLLTIPMPVGHRFISSRGSINRVGRSIQQTLGFHLGSSPELSTVWQESGRQALSIDYGPPYAQGVRPTSKGMKAAFYDRLALGASAYREIGRASCRETWS